MKKDIKLTKWLSLIMGILLIIGGILYLQNPLEGNLLFVKIAAVLIIIVGVLRIFRYFSSNFFHSGGFLIGGFLDIILGVVIFRNLQVSLLTLTMIIGFGVLANGIVEIATSFDLRAFNFSSWWLTLITGILGTVLGFVMIGNFNISSLYMTYMIAINLFMSGISLIGIFFSLGKLENMVGQIRKF